MMLRPLVWRAGIGGVLAFACLAGWIGGGLQKGLSEESSYEAKRFEQAVEPALDKAHRSQDGIVLQNVVQALAGASGVSFACVIDSSGTVVAHNRLSELGKPFKHSESAKNVWKIALNDQQTRWGTLVFSMSNPKGEALWNAQLFRIAIGGGGAYMVFLVCVLFVEKWSDRQERLLAEQGVLLSDEKARFQKLEERLKEYQNVSTTWLQSAVDRIPHGCMVLDQRQRVVAANAQAGQLLNRSHADLIGKSWYDLPQAETSNSTLECLNPPPNQ
jgi:PAS domain-containing protein